MPYGRSLITTNTILPTRVSADGSPVYKAGGVTIDWATVTAVSGSDATLGDGSTILIGTKYLRYGQVLCRITTGSSHTITSTASGGTITYTFTRPDNGVSVTTAAIAYNATAAAVLAAVQAVGGNTFTSATGGVLNSSPVVLLSPTSVSLGSVNNASATGGTAVPTLSVTGASGGKFGPYDPAASDGRQTLTRGDCFILDETVLQYGGVGSSVGGVVHDQFGVIEGGHLWQDRILHSGTATHTLALGPTLAEVIAAFPRVSLVKH